MGRQYAFGSVRDTSRVIYRAHGEIGKGVAGADLAQEGRFLVLSPEAHVDAIPALDIASYDGSASHRLAVSPIPESARFFVAMRGLSRRDGEALIEDGIEREIDDQVSRFCGPLLSRIFRPEEQTDHSVTPSLIP
jgi:Fe-S cluster assembly scaffold protein SufB